MRMRISYSIFEQEIIQLYKYEIYTEQKYRIINEHAWMSREIKEQRIMYMTAN